MHNRKTRRATREVSPLSTTFPDRVTLQRVLDVAARAPSSGNLQPWRWGVDDSAIHLYADWRRQAGGSPTDRRDVLLGCGAVLNHCVVALAAAGWSPRVRRFPDGRDHSHLALLEVVEAPPEAAHVELAGAISRRRADTGPYPALRIPPATLELLHVRAARLGVELAVVPRSRWVRRENGTVALRFSEGAAEPEDGAVLLVLGTESDDDDMRLRAGEALSHLTLTATAMGLASCPLTEPLNDMGSRLRLACEVFDGEAHPQVLIRLGLPPEGDETQPPTDRRLVSETTTWTT
jgi:nitroreductase